MRADTKDLEIARVNIGDPEVTVLDNEYLGSWNPISPRFPYDTDRFQLFRVAYVITDHAYNSWSDTIRWNSPWIENEHQWCITRYRRNAAISPIIQLCNGFTVARVYISRKRRLENILR